jgi:flagellar biosynthesis GTPase FlhF
MSKAFYITSVSNGLVLAHQPSGKPSGVAVENKGDGGDREKWTIEAGDQPNVIALKNVSSGEYLHANGGTNWSTVGTGAKQWWKTSNDNVTAPGACGLSPVEYPNVFLNHFQGKPARQFKDQIKVHMWKWESSYPYWFSWYFLDADVTCNPLASSTAEGSTSSADVEAKLKALEERESALAKKETDLSAEHDEKTKALEERDHALQQKDTDRSAEWDEKMKTLKEREASSAQEEEERTASYDKKLKELQDREAALAKREEELNAARQLTTTPKPNASPTCSENLTNSAPSSRSSLPTVPLSKSPRAMLWRGRKSSVSARRNSRTRKRLLNKKLLKSHHNPARTGRQSPSQLWRRSSRTMLHWSKGWQSWKTALRR